MTRPKIPAVASASELTDDELIAELAVREPGKLIDGLRRCGPRLLGFMQELCDLQALDMLVNGVTRMTSKGEEVTLPADEKVLAQIWKRTERSGVAYEPGDHTETLLRDEVNRRLAKGELKFEGHTFPVDGDGLPATEAV